TPRSSAAVASTVQFTAPRGRSSSPLAAGLAGVPPDTRGSLPASGSWRASWCTRWGRCGTVAIGARGRGLVRPISPPSPRPPPAFEAARTESSIRTIAFPAISTGAYAFPREEAARIALSVLRAESAGFDRVIAVLFSEEDQALYLRLAG